MRSKLLSLAAATFVINIVTVDCAEAVQRVRATSSVSHAASADDTPTIDPWDPDSPMSSREKRLDCIRSVFINYQLCLQSPDPTMCEAIRDFRLDECMGMFP